LWNGWLLMAVMPSRVSRFNAIESETSTQEIESPASGKLRILAVVSETYDVGTLVAEIS
jgi:hypothetical protein